MIRIKFTPCTSRNGACRRRRALRFGIESNLGSNPFGCMRECVYITRVCVYMTRTFSRRCPFKSIASATTLLMEKCSRVSLLNSIMRRRNNTEIDTIQLGDIENLDLKQTNKLTNVHSALHMSAY